MKQLTGLFSFSLAAVLLWGATGVVWAENTKGRWDLGGGFYFVSTSDDIRSNAAFVLFDQPGPDGIPNTGDETILFADPRPDDTLSRETTLDEGLAFNFNAAYGINDWISVQFDFGYYEADVVQLDTYVEIREFVDFNGDGIWERDEVAEFSQSQPFSPGTLTQIPLTASLVFRFRKDSPLNPYLGVGAGYVLIEADVDARLNELNDILSTQAISTVGTNNFFPDFEVCQGPTCPAFQDFELDVEDSFQWHLMGGAEYFVNSKVAVFFDARYTVIGTELKIQSPAFEQNDQLVLNYAAVSDTLPFCGDPQFDNRIFPVNFLRIDNGLPGICRPGNPPANPGAVEERLQDTLLFQGGKIDLTNFTIGIGVRFYF